MPGAHWEYCRGGLGKDFRIFEYTRDTIIKGTTYQVIERKNVPPMPNVGAVYTRYHNDTVYRYVQSKEYPFLVFNLRFDDVYTTFRTNMDHFADSVCRSILPLKPIYMDTLKYGALMLKRWELKDTLYNHIYLGGGFQMAWYRIVERIGFMNDFPFTPNFTLPGHSCELITDMGEGYFLHYYSDNTYNYTTTWNCNHKVGVDELSTENKFKLFPNPSNDVLNISLSNVSSAEITMYTICGQEVAHHFVFKKEVIIPVSDLPAGFYFITCKTANYSSTKTFIINR